MFDFESEACEFSRFQSAVSDHEEPPKTLNDCLSLLDNHANNVVAFDRRSHCQKSNRSMKCCGECVIDESEKQTHENLGPSEVNVISKQKGRDHFYHVREKLCKIAMLLVVLGL